MNNVILTKKLQLIAAFENEFGFIKDKFEIMDLLTNNSSLDKETIQQIKLPSEAKNIVWHPGVYAFIGNNLLYKVGVSVHNSRQRVIQHLVDRTAKDGYSVWDINNYPDKSILLFNVKEIKDVHWLLALEAFFETTLDPKIKSGRIG